LLKKEILIFIGLVAVFSWAEEGVISVSSKVDKSRITIGDLIKYTVTVTHNRDVKVKMPGLGANLGGFEIGDYHVHEPKKKGDKIISTVDYTISTFFTGEFEIPPLTVSYTVPGDSIPKTLTTEKIKIIVESMKPSKEGDIRDIKPPLEIPRNWWYLIRWFVLGIILVALGVFGFIIYRRKKEGKTFLPTRPEPIRPPHELAYEALDKLQNSDLLAKGEIKRFYIEISEIIRQYIEGRYFIVAMEMTTTDVLRKLSEAGVNGEDFQLFKNFFDKCDLVKFAKHIPSQDENDEIIKFAYAIVDRTKVLIEEEISEENQEKLEEDLVNQEEKEG